MELLQGGAFFFSLLRKSLRAFILQMSACLQQHIFLLLNAPVLQGRKNKGRSGKNTQESFQVNRAFLTSSFWSSLLVKTVCCFRDNHWSVSLELPAHVAQ